MRLSALTLGSVRFYQNVNSFSLTAAATRRLICEKLVLWNALLRLRRTLHALGATSAVLTSRGLAVEREGLRTVRALLAAGHTGTSRLDVTLTLDIALT